MDYKTILKDEPRDRVANALGVSTSYASALLTGYHKPGPELEQKLIDLAKKKESFGQQHTSGQHGMEYLAARNRQQVEFSEEQLQQIEKDLRDLPDHNFVKIQLIKNLCKQGHHEMLATLNSGIAFERLKREMQEGH
ncbi:hypothetical protein MTBBW1_2620014 [Desulfamplus magnetovallimortis]|uniref:Uncharacterized protein n=1 Tax=Desulfamplus magnetovallimortis TaxID=1246637 RepID=A0A1W1HF04_9BACT|nr:hypothetical protein [Desulfamplus magnetovallimortis]SLM31050.1 hypothetical protein MTBBW1_2620014 [Desulfamplus magnetovallimortis]